jgi:PadR family transcriptional regulator PadR
MVEPRMTIPTQRVLRVLLEDVTTELYGAEIGDRAELASGTVHPILARLERNGWLESRWEDVDPRAEGRPARRYYRLTGSGAQEAHDALARAYRPRRSTLAPRPVTDQP